jgi:hypothetical protein
MDPFFHKCALVVCAALLGACAAQGPASPAPVPELKPGRLIGYLPIEERINSAAILPPPPTGAETATDEAISRATLLLRGSERWKLATRDANVNFPEAAGTLSCALGAPISEKETPYTYQILRRAASDAGYAGDGAKELYKRDRPFVVNQQSDVTQGRFVGAYSYGQMQTSAEFQDDMRAARLELAAVRARKLAPTRDCKAEVEALKTALPPSSFAHSH